MDNMITVLHKMTKVESLNPNQTIMNNIDGIERPYSLIPSQYYEAMLYITYPEVKSGMYGITTSGQVYNMYTHMPLTPYDKGTGYYGVTLQTNTGGKIFLLHRLVAFQFCNPPINFATITVNHIDGDKSNNCFNNLEWITMAANNQHARELYDNLTNRPNVTDGFVHSLCREFVNGKSNTEIMEHFNMENNNANHTLLRDIRGGHTWVHITSQYTFNKSSKKHAYTKEQKDEITEYIRQGKRDMDIFAIMNGRPYAGHSDNITSEYKTIYSLRKKESERIKKANKNG